MNYHAPWATLPEALQALNTVPLDPKTYDFIDQLTATYHAQPFDPASRFALVEMMTAAFLAGEISGTRKDRARRTGGIPQ